jgi:hypothetical protein
MDGDDDIEVTHVKKTAVLINHFITSTVKFLNHFAIVTEEKLAQVGQRVSSVEHSLLLLEAKLKSIPDISDQVKAASAAAAADLPDVPAAAEPPATASTAPGSTASSLRSDPTYAKYFKLLDMGMPIDHVSLKMESEGVDPGPVRTELGEPATSGAPAAASQPPPTASAPSLRGNPTYGKYFKLLDMGMPAEQVMLKMASEEVDVEPFRAEVEGGVTSSGAAGDGEQAEGATTALVPAGPPVKDDARYKKFFKMLDLGIHPMAVKQKMSMEGLDASVLDMDPNAPAPP